MASYSVLALVALMAATCTANPLESSFNAACQGRGDRPVSNQLDCGSFINCENGYGIKQYCPKGLEFNPENGYCDYPINVPQGVCQKSAPNAGDILCPQQYGVHLVASQQFCNAFFICGNGLLQSTCLFCPQGQYFAPDGHSCQKLYDGQCSGRQFVEPRNQTRAILDPACQPGRGDLFRQLNDKLRHEDYGNYGNSQYGYGVNGQGSNVNNGNSQYGQGSNVIRGNSQYGQGSNVIPGNSQYGQGSNANNGNTQYGYEANNVVEETNAQREYYGNQATNQAEY